MKKVAAKKAAPKKKVRVEKPLVVAVGESCFWVNHGPVVKDLRELHDAFWSMSHEQFAHHVTPERNDFAIWTTDVLSDGETGDKLRQVTSREEAAEIVEEALARYNW